MEIISKLDKILIKSSNNFLIPSNIKMVGKHSVPYSIKEPSDHYGLLVNIEIKN